MGAIFKSSVLIVLGVVPVSVVIATMAGFAIGHLRIRGGQLVFMLFLLGLTLPFEGVIVPLYYEIRGMGLLNTRWAIILPLIGLFMPFGVFWMRAHFLNMPKELSEAARIDGATTWQLFWQVHVPAGAARARVARNPADGLDVEPVPARDRAGRRSDQTDDGGSARRLPGSMGGGHPAPVSGVAPDPGADDRRLLRLPAPLRLRSPAGIAEGVGVTEMHVINHGKLACRHRTPEPLPAWARRRGVTGCFLLSSSRLV